MTDIDIAGLVERAERSAATRSDTDAATMSMLADALRALQAENEILKQAVDIHIANTANARRDERANVDALRERVAGLEKDAARYRFLRDRPEAHCNKWYFYDREVNGTELDAAIDAAIKQATEAKR